MISAVAHSRSSAVNARGPSKCTSFPPTSPPPESSASPGFSPRPPAAAAEPASLAAACFPLLVPIDEDLFFVRKQSRRQQRSSKTRTPITMPTMMSTSCLVLNLPFLCLCSSSSVGAGDGDAGGHGVEAEYPQSWMFPAKESGPNFWARGEGTAPERLLSETLNDCRLAVRLPRLGGISPESALSERSSVLRWASEPSCGGMVPLSLLPARSTSSSFFSLARDSGTGPSRELCARLRKTSW
jgi:hypothetical protein